MAARMVRQVLRGTGMTVGAIVATMAAGLVALLAGVRVEAWGPWFGLLVGLLALAGALTRSAAVSLVKVGEMTVGACHAWGRDWPPTASGWTRRCDPPG